MCDLWMDVDAALAEVPVNIMPLIDDTDFKTREEAVAYDAAGIELIWHFTTTAGATTATVVTPTAAGDYDWAHQDGGMYTIEMTASGGASANNDTEGFGWFTGVADGVLPWRGPIIGFRAAGLNNLLIDTAHSATRGLAGTALPDAVADAATGLIISTAGGLDADAQAASVAAIETDTTEIGAAGAGLTAVVWNASWDAEVESECNDAMIDVMTVDTITLPGQEAPPLAPTRDEMGSWPYKKMRNRKDQSSTLFQLYADNETTVDSKATVSDSGTLAIMQEMVSGP